MRDEKEEAELAAKAAHTKKVHDFEAKVNILNGEKTKEAGRQRELENAVRGIKDVLVHQKKELEDGARQKNELRHKQEVLDEEIHRMKIAADRLTVELSGKEAELRLEARDMDQIKNDLSRAEKERRAI